MLRFAARCAAMIRYRSLSLRAIALVLAIAMAPAIGAEGFGVATWNLNWLLDEATHARWTAACARLGWPVNGEAPAGLPYCDVHNGMAFPPDACASTRDAWPQAARYPDDHPCRETADLATWTRYAQKLDAPRIRER